MRVLKWEPELLTLGVELLAFHRQEVEVRWKCEQQVQNVVTAIVTHDALAFHRGTQLYSGVVFVKHKVPLHSQMLAGFVQEHQEP